jgi:alpha-tubulin suppressor-like RCC1 family protein
VGGPAARWAAVSAGNTTTCAARNNGERWCWGANNLWQLGCEEGSSCAGVYQALEPVRGDGSNVWQAVAVGETHACSVGGGTISCWGSNALGQAGQRFARNFLIRPAGVVQPSGLFASVAAGANHTCAVAADGSAWCWGSASHGQLGEGSVADADMPREIAGGLTWRTIDPGWIQHSCGVTTGNALYCWGAGLDGQIGNGRSEDSYVPTQIEAGRAWTTVQAGLDFACALGGGAIYCWGTNFVGERGSTTSSPAPTRIDDGLADDWVSLSVGLQHSCGIRRKSEVGTRTVWCWGANGAGRAGQAGAAYIKPTQVGSFDDWAEVSAGELHTCGLRAGQLWCWGGEASAPMRIGTASNLTQVSVGGELTCAVDGANQVLCGANQRDAGQPVAVPQALAGRWTAVAVGKDHACALPVTGKLSCWGSNGFGQLGTGGTTAATVPTEVNSKELFVGVALGENFTCARTASKGFCWGRGQRGQLGTGDGSRPLPVRVMGGP